MPPRAPALILAIASRNLTADRYRWRGGALPLTGNSNAISPCLQRSVPGSAGYSRKRRRTEGLRAAVAISDNEIAVALVRKLDGQRPEGAAHRRRRSAAGLRRSRPQENHLRIRPAPRPGERGHQCRLTTRSPRCRRPTCRAPSCAPRRATACATPSTFPSTTATLDVFDLPEQNSQRQQEACVSPSPRAATPSKR